MQLHLVGGFLGSGKTTAIIEAAKWLASKGMRVGVVTNDQGKYLVDTAFMRLSDLPTVEVTGGCFCCRYDDLDERLHQLIDSSQPDVIFAESVGSCTDIVATVVKPLLSLGSGDIQPASFSVFVDGRLFLRWTEGQPLPFSEDVVYIFEKQIEEAGLLVVNKSDLLKPDERQRLESWLNTHHQGRPFRFQNSLDPDSVKGWMRMVQDEPSLLRDESFELDYERYSRGEVQMAWLDGEVNLTDITKPGREVLVGWLEILLESLETHQVGIGHLKFIFQCGYRSTKLSFTGAGQDGWQAQVPDEACDTWQVLVNARAEARAETLRDLFLQALDQAQAVYGFSIEIANLEHFHPEKPMPTHRIN